jgi:5-methyltetrahydrofolate--homocysteine methyltransferase
VIIIGEKINATLTGIKSIVQKQDSTGLLELAKTQAAAGAGFIDVNVGTGVGSVLTARTPQCWRQDSGCETEGRV